MLPHNPGFSDSGVGIGVETDKTLFYRWLVVYFFRLLLNVSSWVIMVFFMFFSLSVIFLTFKISITCCGVKLSGLESTNDLVDNGNV